MNVICVGVYWPSDRTTPDYSTTISSIHGFIDCVIDNNPGCQLMITGDLNFQCCTDDKGYAVFCHLLMI